MLVKALLTSDRDFNSFMYLSDSYGIAEELYLTVIEVLTLFSYNLHMEGSVVNILRNGKKVCEYNYIDREVFNNIVLFTVTVLVRGIKDSFFDSYFIDVYNSDTDLKVKRLKNLQSMLSLLLNSLNDANDTFNSYLYLPLTKEDWLKRVDYIYSESK